MRAGAIRVSLGTHYMTLYDDNSIVVTGVKRLILHPGYDDNDLNRNNDIAALQLIPHQNGIPLGSESSVDVINLPNANQTMSILSESNLYYVGWPQIRPFQTGSRPNYGSRLQWTNATLLTTEQCRAWSQRNNTYNMFCTETNLCLVCNCKN